MGFLDIFKAILGGNPLDGIAKIIEEFHAKPMTEEERKDFEFKMAELGANQAALVLARDQAIEQLQLENVKSARQMQISVRSFLPPLLALTVTIGFFGLLYVLAFHPVPTESKDVLYAMVGVLGTAWVALINFYFGSSSGSAAKTEAITNLLAKK